jgi:hypothetical protein
MSDDQPTAGDRVEGFRALPHSNFAEGVRGTVVEVHDPCPIPSVDEPAALVDTGDEQVPVRLSNLEQVTDDE